MDVWILTREVNEYEQQGEYFVAVFGGKPAHEELTALGVPRNRLRHVLNGGGRVVHENEWFHLSSHTVKTPNVLSTDARPAPMVVPFWRGY